MNKYESRTIRFPDPDLVQWFEREAERNDRSLAYIIRQAMEIYRQQAEETRQSAGMKGD